MKINFASTAILCTALAIPAVATTTFAAPEGKSENREQADRQRGQRGNQLERLQTAIRELDLTEEQQTQIQKILTDARATMAEKREALADMSREERREEMRSFFETVMQQVGAVLDEEQVQKLREARRGGRDGARQGQRNRDGGDAERAERGERGDGERQGNRQRGGMVQVLFEQAMLLELERDQREEIARIGDELRTNFEAAQGDRAAIRKAAATARTELMEVLTDEQKTQLREKVRAAMEEQGDQPRRRQQQQVQRPERENPFGGRLQLGSDIEQADRDVVEAPDDPGIFAVSTPVDTATVKLVGLQGAPITLGDFADKPTVVVFGSITCPHFRDYAPALDQLRAKSARKVNWVWTYTREAHPAGANVDRNEAVDLSIRQHITLDERIEQANRLHREADLGGTVVVEPIDADIADTFDAFPNGAILIDRNGEVLRHERWADPVAIERWLDAI